MAVATDAKLKVLLVIESTSGGSARHVLDLTQGLLEQGHLVEVAFSSLRADKWFLDELGSIEGLRTHVIDMQRNPGPSDIGAALKLRRLIRDNGPFDVLHGHSSKAGALVRLATIGLGSTRVYTPHAFITLDPELGAKKRLLFTAAERFLQFFGEGIICVSEEERLHAIDLGISPKRLFTVENGLADMPPADRAAARQELNLEDSDICLGFVGRLSGQKPVERLVRACASLHTRFPNLVVSIIGDGPDYEAVKELSKQLQLNDQLRMPGAGDGKFLMAGFDAFVLPSRYEGFPYVFLEALARGLPVISTDVGGASAVVDEGLNGYVVPQDQPEQLADSMARVVADPDLLESMRQHSLVKSEQFTVSNMVARTVAVYRRLLAR